MVSVTVNPKYDWQQISPARCRTWRYMPASTPSLKDCESATISQQQISGKPTWASVFTYQYYTKCSHYTNSDIKIYESPTNRPIRLVCSGGDLS